MSGIVPRWLQAERVKVRRLSPAEGQRLQRIVRRGESKEGGNVVWWRRATMLLASAGANGGNTVPVIARLVAPDKDTVREVIHRFNDIGLDCLDHGWAGGRPLLLTIDEEKPRGPDGPHPPRELGQPLTRLTGRGALGHLLHRHSITFQRTIPRDDDGALPVELLIAQ